MGETVPETTPRLRRTIVLIGMMGAGKTAIGKALAARLDAELKDSDAEIVEAAQLSIAEIFERYGEPFFREKESRIIERLLDGPPCILSTGGGAWLAKRNRDILSEKAAVLWLDAELDLLWARVRHKTTRPLLQTDNPRRTLSEIYAARHPIYALAPLHLPIDPAWSIDQTADAVLAMLQEAGAVTRPEESE